MPGLAQGRGAIGETVASFPTYEGAQKAVSALVAADVPARDIAIVGSGLRSVERVTGKLGYATAARSGAINGLLLGLFFSAIFVLGNSAVPVSAFIGVLFVGVALGMLLSIGGYAIVRRRRDFASVTQVIADHYEVTVLPTSIHRAREVLGPVTTVARPPERPSGPPQYGERAQQPPRDADPSEGPPQFGIRTDEPPRYGQRTPSGAVPVPSASEPVAPSTPDSFEPPRYGQRAGAQPAETAPEDESPAPADDEPPATGPQHPDEPDATHEDDNHRP